MMRGGSCTRHFDTCFEMRDGKYVSEALYRQSLQNCRMNDKDHRERCMRPGEALATPLYPNPPGSSSPMVFWDVS